MPNDIGRAAEAQDKFDVVTFTVKGAKEAGPNGDAIRFSRRCVNNARDDHVFKSIPQGGAGHLTLRGKSLRKRLWMRHLRRWNL